MSTPETANIGSRGWQERCSVAGALRWETVPWIPVCCLVFNCVTRPTQKVKLQIHLFRKKCSQSQYPRNSAHNKCSWRRVSELDLWSLPPRGAASAGLGNFWSGLFRSPARPWTSHRQGPRGVPQNSKGLIRRCMLIQYFPGGPVVRSTLPRQGAWVQYLVGELRSYKAQGMAKTKQKTSIGKS